MQLFCLCITSFIAVILILKLYDIARFASLKVSMQDVLLFTTYQIPYVLPFAIPISALISSVLLLQRLSATHEMTALRAAGIGVYQLLHPLLLITWILFILNFYVTFELTPMSRLRCKSMIEKTISTNPLLLFAKNKGLGGQNCHIKTRSNAYKKEMRDVFIWNRDKQTNRIYLISSPKIKFSPPYLKGEDVTVIAPTSKLEEKRLDNLYMESQSKIRILGNNVSQLLRRTSQTINPEYLPTKMLLAKGELEKFKKPKTLKRVQLEFSRRLAYALMALSFPILGMSCGIYTGKKPPKKRIFLVCAFPCMTFIFSLIAKSVQKNLFAAGFCYFFPHFLILLFCMLMLKRLNRGVET